MSTPYDNDRALWLIRLERGLRLGRLDLAGEAVAELRELGIDVRVDLRPKSRPSELDRQTTPREVTRG